MPRFVARDLSGNGPSAQVLSTEGNQHITFFNSASGETGEVFYARDFERARIFIIDIDVGAGDTVLLEVRSDDSQAWGVEQTITVDGAYAFEPTPQFRMRRSVDGGGDTIARLSVRN